MSSSKISEKEALSTLIQIYLSHTTKWYSALVALALGLLVIPLFALNASLNDEVDFVCQIRILLSVFVLLFIDAAIYAVSKVNYSLALLSEMYDRLKVLKTGKTLSGYLIEVKEALRDKEKIFKIFKMRKTGGYKLYTIISIIGFLVIGAIVFFSIWWGSDHLYLGWIISWVVYFISIVVLRFVVQIF